MALPIEDILPKLVDAMRAPGVAVLHAPPGAGKTTGVPLALLKAGLFDGKLLMLEPRRLAARGAAARLAEQLGEPLGQTVGYRMRGNSKSGPKTRIEVITEGILTRKVQHDPELLGIGAVIFDEFHERALVADLGLALTWDIRETLRPDLKVLVMSATLDAAPVAALLGDAPVISSHGRSFPVENHWLDRPVPKDRRFALAMADLIVDAHGANAGGILAFCPGEGEIRRVARTLDRRLGPDTDIRPLYGAMPFKDQRAAIAPATEGRRKVVLATSIAETSLTLDDIRIVVDGGRARRARFDPASGMSRLVTERVTKAEATQRAGRAGRVAPGVAYKLWTKGEDGALQAFPPAEIEVGDLASFALELAAWGTAPWQLSFLTQPPDTAFKEARALLTSLGALENERITDHGRALAALPVHPRLGHMLLKAGPSAARLAALLAERDPMQGQEADLTLRLKLLRDRPKDPKVSRILLDAKRLERIAGPATDLGPDQALALAYPDRIAQRRAGDAPRFLLSGGKGATLAKEDPLSGQAYLAVADTDGDPRDAKIRLALPLSQAALRAVFEADIAWHTQCTWSKRDGKVLARKQERLGHLVLTDQVWGDAPPGELTAAMLEGVHQLGIVPSAKSARLQARVAVARASGLDLPDLSTSALLERLDDWLGPFLTGITTREAWKAFDILPALDAYLGWDGKQRLDAAVPGQFRTPLGDKTPIDYAGDAPQIAIRLQALFGVTEHPKVGKTPLTITLLSPAGRPIQVTQDLPGFWRGSYTDVRKDMRAQYPKHPWPEDPWNADPTLRAKPRK